VNDQLHAPTTLPPGKRPQHQLGRRLGGLQTWYEYSGKEENTFIAPGRNRNAVFQPTA